tara:strand:- start:16741 stop:17442 length:702 start_codon:yes stop_codon:yes gene_type:complete
MKILAFVPARSGSKGIKNKNMFILKKKPLIFYTLRDLNKIKKHVLPFVSTDSLKIRNYSEKFGVTNNYLRPKSLSKDSSSTFDAIKHALKWLKSEKKLNFEAVLLLQPTTPIRDIKDIKLAIRRFKKNKLKSIISVTHMKEHPYDCIKVHGKKINFLSRKPKKTNQRQKYDKNFYFIDGSFYLATTKFLRKNKGFFNKKYTKLFIQKRKWPIDIDDADDLKVADSLMTKAKNK